MDMHTLAATPATATATATPASAPPEKKSATRGTRRAISLLKELAYCREGTATLTQLAHATHLPKPTVHRLLDLLTEEGLIERVPGERGVRLGRLVYELGIAAAPEVDTRAVCAPFLQRVVDQIGDCTYLHSRSGDDGLCLDRREGRDGFQAIPTQVGHRRPLGLGASSLSIMAALPQETAEAVAARNAERYVRHRLTPQRVLELIAAARGRGYAMSVGCVIPGFRGISVAIAGHPMSMTVIAISDKLPPSRIDKILPVLEDEARRMGEALHQAARPAMAARPL
ncbi:IclR family transcriptional regulator [Acuticoccus yangtzensis]|uniref:IclR family transcriptional regulator n=1 Tax=Acuticoccus yangtzensis TaxID=1443441 RepID=UPI0009495574|nr:IclR family transcriptional regulator [Acuticoccus yangtzensis]